MSTPWTGDLVEDIEAAKRIITRYPDVDLPGLVATAADRAAPYSARLACVWTLGFVDHAGLSRAALTRIIDNANETEDLRDHATEALASITSPT